MDTSLNVKEGYQQIMDILNANKHKQFVQRILNPTAYPSIDNEDGTMSTHLMAWSDAPNGKYRVYPTILFDPKTKKLQKYSEDAAYEQADKAGDFIEFDSAEKADWFSKNYKKAWGQ